MANNKGRHLSFWVFVASEEVIPAEIVVALRILIILFGKQYEPFKRVLSSLNVFDNDFSLFLEFICY